MTQPQQGTKVYMTPPRHDDFDKLPPADRALIDRAIFDNVVNKQGNKFSFSAQELRNTGGAPNSQQVEFDIWELRESYADRLNKGGRAAITQEAKTGPANSTSMLDALIAFNGDECGCKFRPAGYQPPKLPIQTVLKDFSR